MRNPAADQASLTERSNILSRSLRSRHLRVRIIVQVVHEPSDNAAYNEDRQSGAQPIVHESDLLWPACSDLVRVMMRSHMLDWILRSLPRDHWILAMLECMLIVKVCCSAELLGMGCSWTIGRLDARMHLLLVSRRMLHLPLLKMSTCRDHEARMRQSRTTICATAQWKAQVLGVLTSAQH